MDLFENPDNQANTPTGQERSPEWEDAFAGMQKLDLFEEEPEVGGPETGATGVTQLFELNGAQPPVQQPAPAPVQPAAPEVPLPAAEAPKAREKEIGKAVFQSLFAGELEEEEPPRAPRAKAGEEAEEPAVQLPAAPPVQFAEDDLDVQPLAAAPTGLFEEAFAPQQAAAELPVPQAAPAQPAAVQPEAPAPEPVWEQPAAPAPQAPRQEASVPVFEQPAPAAAPASQAAFVPDPVPRRTSGPKPIDWHADLLSRIDAARQSPEAPAAPAGQPAPARPAAPSAAAEEPAWKPILESALMDHIPTAEADEAATKVFQPAEPPAPQGAQPVPVQFDTASLDLEGTGSFTVPREPALPPQPEQPAPSARDIASNIAASFGDDDDDFDATLSGIDLSDYPDTSEMEQRAAAEPTSEDIFGSLYDADPDGEDDPPKPRRTRTVQDYPAKKSGSNKKTVIFVVAALALLVLLVAVYFLFLKDKDHKDPAPSGTSPSSGVSLPAGSASTSLPSDSVPADSVPADSIPVEPVVTIPRDEWYMKLANRDHPLSKEEADAITTTNVGGVPVDSRVADAFNQLIAGAKDAGYTLTLKAGYRTYDKQDANYKGGYTDCPAGASEHNLGLSADIFTGSVSSYDDAAYRASAEYQWLKENAASYGFIERYPEGTKDVTGFDPEPWHWRYVGSEQAALIQASGLTLEQYLAQGA